MDSGCEATREHLHNERHNDEHEQHGNDDRGDGSHGTESTQYLVLGTWTDAELGWGPVQVPSTKYQVRCT